MYIYILILFLDLYNKDMTLTDYVESDPIGFKNGKYLYYVNNIFIL